MAAGSVEEMEHQEPDSGDPAGREQAGQTAAGAAGGPDQADAAGWNVTASESAVPESAAASAPPATGEPRVDAALRLLERLPGLPVAAHAELLEQVHAQLSEVLSELDSGPSGPRG